MQVYRRVFWVLGLLVALYPSTQIVSAQEITPVGILLTTLDVLNAPGLISHGKGVTRLGVPADQRQWPKGTVAYASSTHCQVGLSNGSPTYAPSNAIDESPDTFWSDSDDVEDTYSGRSSLIVATPYPLILSSISLVFDVQGVPAAFFVETSEDESSWVRQESVVGNDELARTVEWKPTVARYVRLTFPRAQLPMEGHYTRVTHIYPGPFRGASHWPAGSNASISGDTTEQASPSFTYKPGHSHDFNLASLWPRKSNTAVVEISRPDSVVLPGITMLFDVEHIQRLHFISSDVKVEYTEGLEPIRWSLVEDLIVHVKNSNRKADGEVELGRSQYSLQFPRPILVKKLRVTLPRHHRAAPSWTYLRSLEILPHIRPNHVPEPNLDMTKKTFVELDFGRVVSGYLQYTISALSTPPPSLHIALAQSLDEFYPCDPSLNQQMMYWDYVPTLVGAIDSKVSSQPFRYMRIYIINRVEDATGESWMDVSRLGVSADEAPLDLDSNDRVGDGYGESFKVPSMREQWVVNRDVDHCKPVPRRISIRQLFGVTHQNGTYSSIIPPGYNL